MEKQTHMVSGIRSGQDDKPHHTKRIGCKDETQNHPPQRRSRFNGFPAKGGLAVDFEAARELTATTAKKPVLQN
jgi:hypothetical protein